MDEREAKLQAMNAVSRYPTPFTNALYGKHSTFHRAFIWGAGVCTAVSLFAIAWGFVIALLIHVAAGNGSAPVAPIFH